MKRLFFFCFAVLTACSSTGFGQVRALGSNSLRLGSGETDNNILLQRKRYFEEIANARVFFENFSVGLRYEMSDPSEVGQNFQGIRRRWIEYRKDDLTLQAGHTYMLFGRGLSVNMFESRPINYDSWIDGFSGSYEYTLSKEITDLHPSLGVKAFAGNLDFTNIVDTTKPIEYVKSQGVQSTIGLFNKKLNIGLGFVQAFTSMNEQLFGRVVTTTREVNQPEISLAFITESLEGYFGFTEMRSQLTKVFGNLDSAHQTGQAMYGALSYSSEDFGLTAEYKNYRYFVHAPGAPNEKYLGKLPITNPPEVYKEFTYTTITRTTHAVNFNDELGFQIEANISAIPDFTITLNAAASSRHNGYTDVIDSITKLPTGKGAISVFPEFKDLAYFPFWEMFGEVEYEMGDLNYIKVFGHRRSDVIAFSGSQPDHKRSTTFGAKFQYATTKNQSLLAILEVQDMFDSQRELNDHKLNNLYFSAQYSFNPIITFGGVFDFSTWYEANRHIWSQAFVSFRIGSAHTVLASYGAERAGINCSGGVCRYIPEFKGFRFGLTSQL